jgi:hypothetical protein
MSAQLIEFPAADVRDIERGLHQLLDDIGAGKYDAAHNVVWVIDFGNGRIETGMLGASSEPGPVAHLLLAMAMRKLELC